MGTKFIKAASVALALASPLLVGATGTSTNLDERLLAAHNRERSAVGIQPLAWDRDLAMHAAAWADELVKLGDLEHYSEDRQEAEPQGENLWLGTRAAFSPEEMVGYWIDEKRHFKPGIFPDNSSTGDLADVGHYTQLMWRETGRVGCAVASGAEYDFLVCRYSDAGNVMGERPF